MDENIQEGAEVSPEVEAAPAEVEEVAVETEAAPETVTVEAPAPASETTTF